MMPVPLSYFSPLVGGLPGAVRLGMEPTYYWDGLTEEARAWLRSHTGPGQTIQLRDLPDVLALPPRDRRTAPRDRPARSGPTGLVRHAEPSRRAGREIDRRWVERSRPAFTVTKFGVPLVWVFPYASPR